MPQLTTELPSALYERLERYARHYEGDSRARLEQALQELLTRSLAEVEESEKGTDLSQVIGAGAELWPDDEAWAKHRQRGQAAPLMEVAALARPDGEMQRLSVLLPDDASEWLEMRREVLGLIPELQALYGVLDVPVTLRHILAQTLMMKLDLDYEPSSQGTVQSIYLPQKLARLLQERLDDLRERGDVRANAGLGTMVRRVLASAMAASH